MPQCCKSWISVDLTENVIISPTIALYYRENQGKRIKGVAFSICPHWSFYFVFPELSATWITRPPIDPFFRKRNWSEISPKKFFFFFFFFFFFIPKNFFFFFFFFLLNPKKFCYVPQLLMTSQIQNKLTNFLTALYKLDHFSWYTFN